MEEEGRFGLLHPEMEEILVRPQGLGSLLVHQPERKRRRPPFLHPKPFASARNDLQIVVQYPRECVLLRARLKTERRPWLCSLFLSPRFFSSPGREGGGVHQFAGVPDRQSDRVQEETVSYVTALTITQVIESVCVSIRVNCYPKII